MAGDGLAGVLAQVVPQVPAVGHLDRARRGGADRGGVGAAPVPAGHLGSRMRAQPFLHRGLLPVRQHIHRPAGVHVHQQRRVGLALAQREVVDAQHPHQPGGRLRQRHQDPHQRVPADLHRQHPGQPGPGPPGQRPGDRSQLPGQQRGLPRIRHGQPRGLLSEARPRAPRAAARQQPHPQPDHHPAAASPGIMQPPHVPAAHLRAPQAAPRARRPAGRGTHVDGHQVPLDPGPVHGRPGQVRQQQPHHLRLLS